MFIAIEGADGSGKSSLVSEILSCISKTNASANVITHHKGRPAEETKRHLLYEYAISLEKNDIFNEIHVADRWHWGEITYAPIKRPHTNKDGYGLLGKSGWRWVELFMMSRGMTQFFLYARIEEITARVKLRGDDFIDVSELEAVYDAYSKAAKMANIAETVIPGPDSLNELSAFAFHMIDLATAVARRASFLSKYPQYIGSPQPKVLLIGDQRNITEEYGEETILPFMPVNSNSGDFLLAALPDDLWKHVGIVNGNEIEPHNLVSLHRELGSPPIAALGKLAERALLKTTIHVDDYTVLRHPQFVKRFRHSEQELYGNEIKKVAERKKRR
jgi:hypothetical protein